MIPNIKPANFLVLRRMPPTGNQFMPVDLALQNLRSTAPYSATIVYQRTPATHFSLKEYYSYHFKNRCSYLWDRLNRNNGLIILAITCTVACVGILALTAVVFKYYIAHWAILKQDIVNGKIGLYRYIFSSDTDNLEFLKIQPYTNYIFVRMATLFDYQLEVFSNTIGILTSAIACLTVPFCSAVAACLQIHTDFKENPPDKLEYDRITLFGKQSLIDISLASLNNQQDERGFLLDPLSQEKINPAHICYPRYIKLGAYLFSLPSLVNALLAHDLDEGRLKHPLENRYLHQKEQELVLEKINTLLALNHRTFFQCFNPFNISFFKIDMSKQEQQEFEQATSTAYNNRLVNHNINGFNQKTEAEQRVYITQHKQRDIQVFRKAKLLESLNRLTRQLTQEAHLE